jgi:hypothetical protein
MMTLHTAQTLIISICDAMIIQSEKDDSEDLVDIAIDLTDRASRASDAKELLLAIEIADADLEQLGGFNATIQALRIVAKGIAE